MKKKTNTLFSSSKGIGRESVWKISLIDRLRRYIKIKLANEMRFD